MINDRFEHDKDKRLMAAGILILAGICGFISAINPYLGGGPILTVEGEEEVEVQCGQEYIDAGAKAVLNNEDISEDIVVLGDVNTSELGTYELEYELKYKRRTLTKTRTVHVVDTTGPEITLNGEESVTVDKIEDYQEAGAVAVDNCDGDLTSSITTSMEQVNDYTYEVCYQATDSRGNVGEAKRAVVIQDTVSPEISLNGEASVTIKEREKFQDPGVNATDDRDGDLSDSAVRTGYIDIYRPGTYTVTYTVQDAGGNTAQVSRDVTVERVHTNPQNAIYLTFDDGPSADVTKRVLDILAANNVKATFFICDYDEENEALVQRMIDEGHTVGIHGYSHVYSEVYASADAFMDNINTLRNKVKEDTGYEPFVIRFPGGSSNTVSKEYTPGIMTELVQLVTDADLMYLDWNVSNEDATGNNIPASTLYKNVVNNLEKDRTNVVLMHDTSAKQTTADALQSVIDYGKSNGYAFYAVSEDTVPIHQKLSN
jgi:peptidoglycan/xylan/chitin deacetylase (PgdA/CDA1 family)